MNDKVLHTIREEDLFAPGDRIIVGVSGGADSMALLHFLWKHQEELQVQPIAVHVHHGLRGAAADADQTHVTAWCFQRGIPCYVALCDLPSLSKTLRMGEEECGRALRYAFFSAVANALADGIPIPPVQTWSSLEILEALPDGIRIATAHTLSDNVETVLFHMTRGSGSRGLCGIPAKRGHIVRPLLHVSRSEIEAYCAQYEISYVTDQTNSDPQYARNRIRHQVIPSLERINPAFLQAMERLILQQKEDAAYFEVESENALQACSVPNGYSCQKIAALKPALRHRLLLRIAQKYGVTGAEMRHIHQLSRLLTEKGAVNFPGNITLCSDGNLLFRQAEKASHNEERIVFSKDTASSLLFRGRTVTWHCLDEKKEENFPNVYKKYSNSALDYDIIPLELVLRTRQSGDTLRLAHRGVKKSLKKWMNEMQVPVSEREERLVLEGDGKVLWVEGLGACEEACAGENTRRVCILCPDGEF